MNQRHAPRFFPKPHILYLVVEAVSQVSHLHHIVIFPNVRTPYNFYYYFKKRGKNAF